MVSAEGCADSFDLVSEAADGLSSTCPKLDTQPGKRLYECISQACELGANVINFYEDKCQLLKCETSDELQLSTKRGAAEVYSVVHAGE